MLERIAGCMEIPPGRVALRLYSERATMADGAPLLHLSESGSAGMYEEAGGQAIVWLEQSHLSDPLAVAATLAHELGHVHLLGDRRVSIEEEDHELLTDLLTVFFGMGVIAANATLRETQWRSQGWYGWSMGRQGYLTPPVFGYALALFAAWRSETAPRWAKSLRPDVRSPFRRSLRMLERRGGAVLPVAVPRPPALSPLLPEIVSRGKPPEAEAEQQPETPPAHGEEDILYLDETTPLEGSADQLFMEGIARAHEGRHAEAVDALTAALEFDPEDGEIYQHRAASLIELGRIAEALADAEAALARDPDDWIARRTRGLALLRQGDPRAALADFEQVLRECYDVWTLYYRSEAWARFGDYRRAIDDLSRVLRVAPDWIDALQARRLCYEILGQTEEAERDRRALEELQAE